ncbi:MAG: DNA translocase FtsK 4TM domain-containing protein [Nitrospinae bacterium]|nr:DNA translocase FtsK 4TM domain-containing protein [Nitrospinota bacterium]
MRIANQVSKKSTEPSRRKAVFMEVAGVALIALAVMLVVSLYSYNPADPSFNNYLSDGTAASNKAGIIGACLADMAAQAGGSVGWLIPAALLYLGVSLFTPFRLGRLLRFMGGLAGLALMAAAFSNLYWEHDPLFSEIVPGGMLGALVGGAMARWFSVAGSYIILSAAAVSAILYTTGLSLGDAAEKLMWLAGGLGRMAAAAGAWVWGHAVKLGEIRIPVFMSTAEADVEEERAAKLPSKKERLAGMARARGVERADEDHAVEESAGADESGDDDMEEEEINIKLPARAGALMAEIDPENPPPLPLPRNGARGKNGAGTVEIKDQAEFQQAIFDFGAKEEGDYVFPPLNLLDAAPPQIKGQSRDELLKRSMILERKLLDFGVEGKVIQVSPGPVVTMYEFEPAPGIKVSKIAALADDLAMSLRATSVRVLAPIPGKSVVGVEVPNPSRETVYLREMLASGEFSEAESWLSMALGKDIGGTPVMADLAAVPHLLIAGSTGSGKSVGINAMILSILYRASPADVKFIMIDPKMLELSIYEGIPHLIAPVVTNPKKAANALRWAVAEMERRYQKLSELGVRNIDGYNRYVEKQNAASRGKKRKTVREMEAELAAGAISEGEEKPLEKLPYVVVVIDELADLMMVASKDVEDALARLAQMARAAGIHLIVATQRPSVDVLTGLIKANFPARISYQVRTRVDSRTILDSMGAETLLGRGDMLYLPPGTSRLRRIHGPFVSDQEIHRVVDFLKGQQQPVYDEQILETPPDAAGVDADGIEPGGGAADEFYDQAVELVAKTRQASVSMVQRRFRIGYNRAARIVEMMERQGLVGPADGLKPREVFVRDIEDVEKVN